MVKKYDDWWTSGFCSGFAEALQRRFGGELWAIVNHSEKYPEDDFLLHAYCIIDGMAYDALGAHPISEASDISVWPIEEMDRDDDVVIQWQQVDSDWFARNHEDYETSIHHMPQAMEYIQRKHKLFGQLKALTDTQNRSTRRMSCRTSD